MSSFVRRISAVSLLILSAGFMVGVQASASPAPQTSTGPQTSPAPQTSPGPAQVGAGWIGRQFSSKGDIAKDGAASSTVQAVLALAAAGVGGTKADAGMAWLEKHFPSYVNQDGADVPGALSYLILAAQAMGVDPTTFGGTGTANNLIVRLENTQQPSGLFGTQDPTYDGAFRQGLALMALANQGISNPAGVSWLQSQQCSDGGWEAYQTTGCTAPEPSEGTGPDTNSTSLAVEGLVAQSAVDPAENSHITSFLESAQNSDGGFGYIGLASPSSVQPSDPDSTGEVIQALVALGQLSNPAFTQTGGSTPITALSGMQLGCSSSKGHRGAYVYPGVKGPNLLATLQAVPGAAEVAFPLKAQTLQPGLPKLAC
jgi:hypothetical protein